MTRKMVEKQRKNTITIVMHWRRLLLVHNATSTNYSTFLAAMVGIGMLPFFTLNAAPAKDPPDLNIVFSRALVSTPGIKETELDVAEELDTLCASTTNADLLGQCSTIVTLTDEKITQTLREIAPDEIPIQGSGTLDVAVRQINNVRMRLQSLRTEAPRLALNGLLFNIEGQSIPASLLVDNLLSGGASADSIFDDRLGVFLSGVVGFGDKDTTARELGYDFKVYGITSGVDYRVTQQWVLGGALAYANNDSDFVIAGGSHEGDAWSVSAYGSYYPTQQVYADWIVSYGINEYTTKRNINTLGAGTQGETDGDQWSVSLSMGSDFHHQSWLLTPYGSVEFITASIDGYTETGGNGLALEFSDQRVTSLMGAVGLRASLTTSHSWGVLSPSAYIEWIHEFEDDARRIISRFVVDPSSTFSVRSDAPDRDYFNVGFSLTATLSQGRMGFISAETLLDQDNLEQYQVFAGIRIELW